MRKKAKKNKEERGVGVVILNRYRREIPHRKGYHDHRVVELRKAK